jgi:hypothetical protein
MEDKTLPPEGLSGVLSTSGNSGRRTFLRRAVAVGVPVVLATVKSRSLLARGANDLVSGCGSVNPSCATLAGQEQFEAAPAPAQGSTIDLTPPGDSQPGKGHGKGIDLSPPDDSQPGNGNGKGSGKK